MYLIELTLDLSAEEMKSALAWSANGSPKRVESFNDEPDFPCFANKLNQILNRYI